MSSLRNNLLLFFLALVIVSCESPENETPTKVAYYGSEFYQIEVGRSWTYKVDSSAFNKLSDSTVFDSYIQRIRIGSIFFQNETDTTYKLEVFTSHDTISRPLKLTHTYQLMVKPLKIILIEENFPLVKLIVPFFNNQQWEGNEFNNLVSQKPYFRLRLNDTKTQAVVTEQADSSCLGVSEVYSTYERNVGLSYFSRRFVEFVQDPLNPCATPLVINNERRLSMQLLYTHK